MWASAEYWIHFHARIVCTIWPISVSQISRNLNTTRRPVSQWILSKQNFKNRFSKKKTQKLIFFPTPCDFRPPWLRNDLCMGCLVFIFTTGINSKLFPWPVHSVEKNSPKFSATSDANWRHIAHNANASSDDRLLSHVTCTSWQKIEISANHLV